MAFEFNPFTGKLDITRSNTELDARYLKLSGSLAEVSNHSHTVLTDIGTNTHAQIDTFIGTTVPTTYLPLAGGTMVGNLILNDNVSLLLGTGSDGELFHDGTNTYFQNNTGGIIIENDASDGDITFKVNDGGVDTTVMTIDGATGNVGIGTTSPTQKLEVSGGMSKFSGIIINSGSSNSQLNTTLYNAVSGIIRWGNVDQEVVYSSPLFDADGVNTALYVRASSTGDLFAGLDGSNNRLFTIHESGGFAIGNVYYATDPGVDNVIIEGNVGIGTTAPTNILSLGGNVVRKFWLERHTTANTAGNTLTITAGGATAGATDKNGGDLLLQGGLSTGTGESGVQIYGCVAGATGTADRTQTLGIQLLGNKLSFYGVTPIARAVLATGASHTVDDIITALQNLGLVSQT